ncbi:MAG TPA: glycoside hydrolase family 2 TIM barrel-domain containing protein [Solirubrobacteraceae bacterium]|nr:glycoside hydrolase family 2 TIM barrel-domain containing protein [Solirubrobacteraceae bacterium]
MRRDRSRQDVSITSTSNRPAWLVWAVSGGTLALGAVVALILLAAGVFNASGAPTDPLPVSEQPWVQEGPTNRIALRDNWVRRLDPKDHGFDHDWSQGGFAGTPVAVPNDANPEPVTGEAGIANFQGSIAWYRTKFTVPADGVYELDFQSADERATVWIDGTQVGSSHVGTYLPFARRFQTTAGPHTLVVRTDFRDPAAQSAAGFHRTWFNFGGLNGEVTLRPIAASDLSDPTIHTTLAPASDGSVEAAVNVTVLVQNNGPARTVTPTGTLDPVDGGGGGVTLSFPAMSMAAGQSQTASANVTIEHPNLWSTTSPNLYQLDVQVSGESDYQTKVGLRELTTTADHHILLNGQPLTLRGASIQEDAKGRGDALTPADQDSLVSELKTLGANATRSQHPLDPGLLEKLDAAGIVVWQGIGPVDASGNWASKTPALEKLAETRAKITVRQAQTHPSIIAWNLANEVGGNGHPGGQATYVEHLADWIHTNDPGRLVALDIWGTHPPKVAGPIYANVDAIGETDYLGWYEGPLDDHPNALAAAMRARLGYLQSVFPSKVLIVTEFGAEANSLNGDGTEPGGYAYQSHNLVTHIHTYESLPYLSGMLVWDLRDFAVAPTFDGGSIRNLVPNINLIKGLNQKGLINYSGAAKPAFDVVKAQFTALAAQQAQRQGQGQGEGASP